MDFLTLLQGSPILGLLSISISLFAAHDSLPRVTGWERTKNAFGVIWFGVCVVLWLCCVILLLHLGHKNCQKHFTLPVARVVREGDDTTRKIS